MPIEGLKEKELGGRFDVSPDTLRLYEDLGFLHPIQTGAERHYTAKDHVTLEVILKGKRLGFSLAEIGRLIGVGSRDARPEIAMDHAGGDTIEASAQSDRMYMLDQIQRLTLQRREIETAIAELEAALRRDP